MDQAGNVSQKKHTAFAHVMMNPLVRKLDKVDEKAEGDGATYSGIVAKTLFFIIMTGVGIALDLFVHQYYGTVYTIDLTDYTIVMQEMGFALIACVFIILSPLLIWVIRPLIPILGTLYCVSQGYFIAWLCQTFGNEYRGAAWASFGLTVLILVVMLFLYIKGIVKVTKKFRSVVTTLFISAVFLGLGVAVCNFVPPLHWIYNFFMENMAVSIIASVAFIIIGSLFLLVDFECIKHTVEDELPKKYEWVAAMALVFTIIWLYFKILNLLLKLKSTGGQK